MKVNLFQQPEGTTIDNVGNIFVADAGRDSVFKFNSSGDELQSFGGPDVFNKPYAVAVFDRTVYVADRDNNRILRFIVSTEIY
jgi:DNA-binding beta-propeller fold protein YncE